MRSVHKYSAGLTAACLSAAILALIPAAAHAQSKTLSFKLVVMGAGPAVTVSETPGNKISTRPMTGVAMLPDGTLALKSFVNTADEAEDHGSYQGYSTYTMQNGDSLTLSYTGGWDAKGDHGIYKVLSGTGAYAGATGTGRFDGVDVPAWKEAFVYDVRIDLDNVKPTQ